jgi:hypothetical protein
MTYCRGTANVKRISLFSRDLREKRDGSDVSSSRVAHVLLVSLTIHEERGHSQAGC